MQWMDLNGRVVDGCAVFFRVAEEFGALSNMAGGFPLCVCGIDVPSSEALFQSMRYPAHPEIQREIISQKSPMAAKMMSKKDGRRDRLTRSDWDVIRVDVMRWCLNVKLAQNFDRFFEVLISTGNRPIVERSRKDRSWGAVLERDGLLRGENWLGCLLSELRCEVKSWLYAGDDDEAYPAVLPPPIDDFLLLGDEIGPVDSE